MSEAALFSGLLLASGAWGYVVFRRQTRRQQAALVRVQRVVDQSRAETADLDALECAIEEYVQQRRNGEGAACRTKPRSSSR